MAENDEKAGLTKLRRVMQTFRTAIDPEVSVQLAQAFLLVCEDEDQPVYVYSERAGSNHGTMSRHLINLADKLRAGTPGYMLIAGYKDPNDKRSSRYKLTPKGRALRNTLKELMEE